MRSFKAALVASLVVLASLFGLSVQAQALTPDAQAQILTRTLDAKEARQNRTATPRIVGSGPIAIEQAPYTVAIQWEPESGGGVCSGSILDATHILTAGHCVKTESTIAAPADVLVGAGRADLLNPATSSQGVVKGVSRIFVHPGFTPYSFNNDVAVLELSSPLNLSGPSIQAIGMVPSKTTVISEGDLVFNGFGITADGADDFGTLREAQTFQAVANYCGTDAPGAIICTADNARGFCQGDSGGPARTAGTRLLVGVINYIRVGCAAFINASANIAAPENRVFIDAALQGRGVSISQIPRSPRYSAPISVKGKVRSGGTVRCSAGSWTGKPIRKYRFVIRKKNGTEVTSKATSKNKYRIKRKYRGLRIYCSIYVRNAGGDGVIGTFSPKKIR